jgi:hypothetical protein
MPYASIPTVIDFNPYKVSSTQMYALGTQFNDGEDVWRYGKVGASTITKGKLQTAPAPKANHHNTAVTTAQAVGDKTVTVTLGATAAVADEYAEGFVVFNDVATGGYQMRVKTHPAASSAASLTLTFYEPLPSALTTSSKATLVHNTYNGVIEGTSQTVRLAGVSEATATTGQFCWFKTRGVASLLADQAITVGGLLSPSTSISGAVIEVSATFATAEKTMLVGDAFIAGVDTEKRPVRLTIE